MKYLLFIALAMILVSGYDFTKPKNGDELLSTLMNEKKDNWIVFFHKDLYEGDDETAAASQELVDNMKDDIATECKKQNLSEEDYKFVDVEIILEGTMETDTKRYWGDFLYNIGFEDGNPPDGAQDGTEAANAEDA